VSVRVTVFNLPISAFPLIWRHLRCDVGLEEGEYK